MKENEFVKVCNKSDYVQQKIVVKVCMCCQKCRTKVMKIAATESGVSSVQISGEGKDQVVVVGDEIDSVCLTRSLRKKVCSATILSVEEVKEKKKEEPQKKDKTTSDAKNQPISPSPPLWNVTPCPQFVVCHEMVYDPTPDPCSIM